MKKVRAIAIYLPQFHPIPENDLWWGKGFTEWTNVTKSKPLFRNHLQPRLSTEMGFYDLRSAFTRHEQAHLAKEHCIEGFAYYHYWFKGKRLLNHPFDEVLATGEPDFSFCLIWANETWSRRWLGEEKEILIKQEYSEDDDHIHADYLVNVFKDKRYICVDGRPVFTIYRPTNIPNVSKTIFIIREKAIKAGLPNPFLVASNSHFHDNNGLLNLGFDAILNFRPQLSALPNVFNDAFIWKRMVKNVLQQKVLNGKYKIYTQEEAFHLMQAQEPDDFNKIIPCVFVGWDNTARRGDKGIVLTENSPEIFGAELERQITKLKSANESTGLLFINAWNEWAEGNYLEPDQHFGRGFLKQVKSKLTNAKN